MAANVPCLPGACSNGCRLCVPESVRHGGEAEGVHVPAAIWGYPTCEATEQGQVSPELTPAAALGQFPARFPDQSWFPDTEPTQLLLRRDPATPSKVTQWQFPQRVLK